MLVYIKEYLLELIRENNIDESEIQLPDVQINTDNIKAIMINEVPPQNPTDYFYSKSCMPDYMKTTLELFHNAGMEVRDINDILNMGIYITTAVKSPKLQYAVSTEIIINHLPVLENEIDMFPNLRVVMLMGDVAKKAFNMIAKKRTKRNAIPSESTYKIRGNEFYYGNLRVFPSYIMTGGNILIEKTKCAMISDDISRM
ncbi:MAG: uracil-DNA glycosylase family protein, partial [Ruminiclostridium sp.]